MNLFTTFLLMLVVSLRRPTWLVHNTTAGIFLLRSVQTSSLCMYWLKNIAYFISQLDLTVWIMGSFFFVIDWCLNPNVCQCLLFHHLNIFTPMQLVVTIVMMVAFYILKITSLCVWVFKFLYKIKLLNRLDSLHLVATTIISVIYDI